MRRSMLAAAAAILAAGAAAAQDGDFDGWVLALSWSPSWCAADPGRTDAEQCLDARRFIVHGLWPQRGRRGPEFCPTDRRDPGRRETEAMADLMGSAGLARHAWRKHGRCADMDPADYFALTRRAAAALRVPETFLREGPPRRITGARIEAAFLAANPSLTADMITITCDGDQFTEIRACLSRDLSPTGCGTHERRACREAGLLIPSPD